MMMIIDKVMSVIDMNHCGDVLRGFIDIVSIWWGIFSLVIPMIDSIRGLEDFEFTDMPW
jgi:hypothetical protein